MLPTIIIRIHERLMRIRRGIQMQIRPREVVRQANRFRPISPRRYRPSLTGKVPRGGHDQRANIILEVDVHGKPFAVELRPHGIFRIMGIVVQKGEVPELTGEVSRVAHFEFSKAVRVIDDVEGLRGAQITVC